MSLSILEPIAICGQCHEAISSQDINRTQQAHYCPSCFQTWCDTQREMFQPVSESTHYAIHDGTAL